MPFLFKLSERVARMRSRAVVLTVAAILACEFTNPSLSSPPDPRFATAAVMPGDVLDLAAVGQTSASVTLAFTQVDDGTGQAAKYDIRSAPGTTVDWGSAASVASGSCSPPVVGSGIGAKQTCTVLGLSAGTAYAFELVAYRGTLNQGATVGALSNVVNATTAVADAPTGPGTVIDLTVVGQTSSAVTLAFSQVDDGTGQPAKYEIRSAPGTTVDWGSAASVASGSCSTPVVGSGIGARRTCTVLGLTAGTAYAFELVAYRGTLNQGATFGALSNVVNATTAVADAPTGPGTVIDLTVVGQTSSAVTLAFSQVDDGTGQPAKYEIRSGPGTAVGWGSAAGVAGGSGSTPVVGSGIGARRTCTVLGLTAGTAYAFELVAYRGTLNQGATFGALSNVVRATTAASTAPVASVTVSLATASVNVGQTVQLTATLKDPSGSVLSGRTATWVSSAPAVAMVSGGGLVTGVGAGSATLTATSEGQSGSATLQVVAPSPGGQVDTIFREDFESGSLNWDDSAGGPTHVVVRDGTLAYSGSHYLKILYPLGVNGGGSLSKFLGLPGYTKAFVRYHFRIPGNFAGGTKLFMFRGSRIY